MEADVSWTRGKQHMYGIWCVNVSSVRLQKKEVVVNRTHQANLHLIKPTATVTALPSLLLSTALARVHYKVRGQHLTFMNAEAVAIWDPETIQLSAEALQDVL